jgi:preprotein translocase subunit Sec63
MDNRSGYFAAILIRWQGYQYLMAAITAESVREAAEILGIGERASLHEIRLRYHEWIREWHPDVSQKDPAVSHDMTIRLKEAYDLLVDYGMNHAFSFRIEDLAKDLEQTPADYWMERFGDDPIWG